MSKKTHDLVVKVGTYEKDGETKGRYKNVRRVLRLCHPAPQREDCMINDGTEICLMVNDAQLPACLPGRGTHEFVSVESPAGNRSGWHVDKCRWCGVKQSYDTSD